MSKLKKTNSNEIQVTLSVNDLASSVLKLFQKVLQETVKSLTSAEKSNQVFNNTIRDIPKTTPIPKYVQELKSLKKILNESTKEILETSKAQEQLNDSFGETPEKVNDTSDSVLLYRTSLLKLVSTYAILATLSKGVDDAVLTVAEIQQINTRLKGLTSGDNALNDAWLYLKHTADAFNVELLVLADSFAKLLALKKAGILTTSDAKKILEGFSNIAAETGASTTDLKLSLFGLAQGLSAGTLRAEELNQVTDPLPGLLQALDRASGKAAGGFRKMTLEGETTSEMLRTTLMKAFGEYENAAAKTSENLGPTFIRMKNAYTYLKLSLAKPIKNFLTPFMNMATAAMKRTADATNNLVEILSKYELQIKAVGYSMAETVRVIGSVIGATIKFITDNKELLLILGSLLVTTKLVTNGMSLLTTKFGSLRNALTFAITTVITLSLHFKRLIAVHLPIKIMEIAMAVQALAQWFKAIIALGFRGTLLAIAASITTVYTQFTALITVQIVAWFTGGAVGALALVSALGKLALVLAAGFAVYEIVKLGQALYGLYQTRQLLREATEEQAYAEEGLKKRLQKISRELGIIIPDMKTYKRLLKEGVIVENENDSAKQWVKAKDAVIDYKKEIQNLEELITQKTNVLAQKRVRIGKEEKKTTYAMLKGMLTDRVRIDAQIVRDTELTLREIENLHRQATQRIKDLYRDLAAEQRSFQDLIAEITRRGLGTEESIVNIKTQLAEKLTAAKIALANKEYSTAISIAKEIKRIASSESKSEDNVLLTKEWVEYLQKALALVNQAYQEQIAQTKQFQSALQNKKIVITTEISQAEQEIERLKNKLQELKDKTVTVTVEQKNVYGKGGQVSVPKLASGGWIQGTGNTDNVPALLTPGEFVIRKSRSAIFKNLLEFLNYGSLPQIEKFLNLNVPKFNLSNLINIPKSLPAHYAQGGEVTQVKYTPVETIRFEWQINGQQGQVETLMGQRKNLNALVSAINNVKRGL